MFQPTELNLRNYRIQRRWRRLFLGMTVLLILPVAIILTLLIIRGGPAISWEFLFTFPKSGMTAGGIFPALLGTILLVLTALVFSVPLGIAAAIYLSEYAPDNWLTRSINLAIIN
ncbi:MAG: phosphate ABC transporter, permease protein PstA, partial [Rhodothermales bacterium]|nr:phosphate ABC transporter, permease protein PstA [Rhodothermales bacterium]